MYVLITIDYFQVIQSNYTSLKKKTQNIMKLYIIKQVDN